MSASHLVRVCRGSVCHGRESASLVSALVAPPSAPAVAATPTTTPGWRRLHWARGSAVAPAHAASRPAEAAGGPEPPAGRVVWQLDRAFGRAGACGAVRLPRLPRPACSHGIVRPARLTPIGDAGAGHGRFRVRACLLRRPVEKVIPSHLGS